MLESFETYHSLFLKRNSRFQVAGMCKSEKKEGVKALKQIIPGISSVEFVGDKIVEFKHSTTTTTDQISMNLPCVMRNVILLCLGFLLFIQFSHPKQKHESICSRDLF